MYCGYQSYTHHQSAISLPIGAASSPQVGSISFVPSSASRNTFGPSRMSGLCTNKVRTAVLVAEAEARDLRCPIGWPCRLQPKKLSDPHSHPTLGQGRIPPKKARSPTTGLIISRFKVGFWVRQIDDLICALVAHFSWFLEMQGLFTTSTLNIIAT